MGHLGVVLYEYLGEEYPEVLGSILGALKVRSDGSYIIISGFYLKKRYIIGFARISNCYYFLGFILHLDWASFQLSRQLKIGYEISIVSHYFTDSFLVSRCQVKHSSLTLPHPEQGCYVCWKPLKTYELQASILSPWFFTEHLN